MAKVSSSGGMDGQLTPLLLKATEASKLCGLSVRTWWRKDSAGETPAGIKVCGKSKRWRREDLELWINLGCPNRLQFERLKLQEVA